MTDLDDFEPIVLLNDGENFSGLGGALLIVLTQEEAEHVADDDDLPAVMARPEVKARTIDLEDLVRWALDNGYPGMRPPTAE
jgi:hypothetical protein